MHQVIEGDVVKTGLGKDHLNRDRAGDNVCHSGKHLYWGQTCVHDSQQVVAQEEQPQEPCGRPEGGHWFKETVGKEQQDM